MKRPGIRLTLLAVAALSNLFLSGGCAYFNTYYSAKRNFDQAERMYDNPEDRANAQQIALYDKAIASAAKLVASYPKSKWVDDAVYLTGRSLYAKGEDEKARQTFTELADKFPDSPYIPSALYYTAETYRREHKWDAAEVFYDSLRTRFPKNKLLDQTTMRDAQVELAQLRPRNAVTLLNSFDHEKLAPHDLYEWHHALADAYYAVPVYDSAYTEYGWVAAKSRTQDSYHQAMMRMGDCLEGAREFDMAAQHYHDYESDARTPEYRDQASIRRASAMAAGGHVNDGLALLQSIVNDKTRVNVAPQALYQIGFIQETVGEDTKAARATYAHVSEQYKSSPYNLQAQQRIANLDKMDALRAQTVSDTTGKEAAAAAAFGIAERYLVDSDQPERAVHEYAKVEHDYAKTMVAPKAAFAAGWVYYRKLQHKEAADSVWKHVVAEYPETPYGHAASAILRGREDSLRTVGMMGSSLIKMPYSPNAQLYVPPEAQISTKKTTTSKADSIAAARKQKGGAGADSLGAHAPVAGKTGQSGLVGPPAPSGQNGQSAQNGQGALIGPIFQKPDTTKTGSAKPDTSNTVAAKPDTTQHSPAPPDTTVHKNSGATGPVAPAGGR